MAKVKVSAGMVFERYEKKYRLPEATYRQLMERLDEYMQADQYGRHTICSLYFDTKDYLLIRCSIGKPKYKEKLRLRSCGTPEAKSWSGRGGPPNVQAWFNGGEVEAVSGGDTVDSNGNIYVTGGTLRLSSPPWPDYEGALLCNGDVTITGGTIASVGCMGVNVYWAEQPILWVSHRNELPKGTVLSLRDEAGKIIVEMTTRDDAVQSVCTSPELLAGSTYALYIDDEKKIEVTLSNGMNVTGDDGGAFTGGYSRGNMANYR